MKKKSRLLFFAVVCLLFLCNGSYLVLAQPLAERLSGQILIQVEDQGQAWYLNPVNQQRYFLNRPAEAFAAMRVLGLGISNDNLAKIPIGLIAQSGEDADQDGLVDLLEQAIGSDINNTDSDGDGYPDRTEVENWYSPIGTSKMPVDHALIDRLRGRILLQVESRGEAWYLYPDNGQRYFLGRPADAFQIMNDLGLGITNQDLSMIEIAPDSAQPAEDFSGGTEPEAADCECGGPAKILCAKGLECLIDESSMAGCGYCREVAGPFGRNCQTDYDCLANAVQACAPTYGYYTFQANYSGVVHERKYILQIVGEFHDQCEISLTIEQAKATYSAELRERLKNENLSDAVLDLAQDQSNRLYNQVQGWQDYCAVDKNVLSVMIDGLKTQTVFPHEYENSSCHGKVFYSQK